MTASSYAILCAVGRAPEVISVPCDLAAMQAAVGGHVECLELDPDGIDLWCNENGLFLCQPNRLVEHQRPIYGDFFICGHDGDGETRGLSADECIEWLTRACSWPVACTAFERDE